MGCFCQVRMFAVAQWNDHFWFGRRRKRNDASWDKAVVPKQYAD